MEVVVIRQIGFVGCLVGFPGVGKLTIARILARMTGAVVVDNHWINDPILKLVTNESSVAVPDAVWPQIAKVREAVLETITTLGSQGASYIFTYAGSDEDPADRAAFEDYHTVARRRGARFIAVRLLCGEQELVRRIQSVERRGRKLTDPGEAIENVRAFTPLNPRTSETLSLDVTNLSAEGAASAIATHFGLTPP
jgi:predicted kinase